ncbi:hypothetical protein [Streptomyces sp. B1I3]|uniref:hypothetical protein n=1 Tax=Streptomyces sp. B1I3 TaxID=3042264 RepID=UPI002783B55C|nr:hypothetical protein [Streptomyces sp. B1I3]MDQ0797409.1 hypothetical protein [Streptomyces sp. B1I3]
MRTFRDAYRAHVAEEVRTAPSAGIHGGFAVGRDLAVIAPDPESVRRLAASQLLVLHRDPDCEATGDVRMARLSWRDAS